MMKDQEILNAVKEMRISWKENDDKRDSGLPHDIPEVTRIDDLQYGEDPKWNLLDLYLPKNVKGAIKNKIQSPENEVLNCFLQ